MLEEKSFESPLEERKERRSEEMFMKGLGTIYTYKGFSNVASPKSVCQIKATCGCHKSIVTIIELPKLANTFRRNSIGESFIYVYVGHNPTHECMPTASLFPFF